MLYMKTLNFSEINKMPKLNFTSVQDIPALSLTSHPIAILHEFCFQYIIIICIEYRIS